MARMTSFKQIRCERANESDEEHELIMKAFEEKRLSFDNYGVLGTSSAKKTADYRAIVGDSTAFANAKAIIEEWVGLKEPHRRRDMAGHVVFIFDQDEELYVKVMFMLMRNNSTNRVEETLIVDIHPHG